MFGKAIWLEIKREAQRYRDVYLRYWILILSFICLFTWLITFPLQGPILEGLMGHETFLQILAAFLLGHVLGLVLFGILGYFFLINPLFLFLGVLYCTVTTIVIRNINIAARPYVFFSLGLFSALAFISWIMAFRKSVLPNQRGRTLALGLAGAYLIFYVMNWFAYWFDVQPLLISIGAIMLLVPILLIYWNKNTTSVPATSDNPNQIKLLSFWPFLPFIFGVYTIEGLIHSIIFPMWFGTGHVTEPFHLIFGVLPQIVIVFIAGAVADMKGRRFNAIIGATMIGSGFMLFALLSGTAQDISTHMLTIGGFAFLDVFIWVVLADISSSRLVTIYYGFGLGIHVSAQLLGVLLGGKIVEIAGENRIVVVGLAGLFSFLSLAVIPSLTETLIRTHALVPQQTATQINQFLESVNFTKREMDVAKLLAAGASTDEILHELVIAPDTLKSHLRNIYGKVGAKNRLEFTLLLVNELQNTE